MAGPRRTLIEVLTGRTSQRTYWISSGGYIFVFIIVQATHLIGLIGLLLLPLIWIAAIAAPRLRDAGFSPWWVFIPMGGGFVMGFIKGFWAAAAHPGLAALQAVQVIYGLAMAALTLGFMIWLGVTPSRTRQAPTKMAADPALTDVFD